MTEAIFRGLTTEIVSAYVQRNPISAADLPALITTVYSSLATIDAPAAPVTPDVIKRTPAQIRKSITAEGLVSFEDGKTYQTLKRHLAGRGLTLNGYKAKWGLPMDYPTTAPAYAAKRSALAKSLGLGRKAVTVAKSPEVSIPLDNTSEAPSTLKSVKRGRKKVSDE
jgi:predicted transcriptional regulator